MLALLDREAGDVAEDVAVHGMHQVRLVEVEVNPIDGRSRGRRLAIPRCSQASDLGFSVVKEASVYSCYTDFV